jgi:hypothetical protein
MEIHIAEAKYHHPQQMLANVYRFDCGSVLLWRRFDIGAQA